MLVVANKKTWKKVIHLFIRMTLAVCLERSIHNGTSQWSSTPFLYLMAEILMEAKSMMDDFFLFS